MIRVIANSLWFGLCVPESMAFRKATWDAARTQRQVLRRITGFNSVEEFQARHPLSEEPGEPREPVLRRLPTSGTAGPVKWIPYTASLYREFQRGIAPWVVDLFSHNPPMMAGRSYWAISPVGDTGTEFGDDTEYLGGSRRLVSSAMAVPTSVRHIRNIDDWRRETMRYLASCRDLTFISIWHPSFLTLLLEGVDEPAKLWPKLKVISCWGESPELQEKFPNAKIQPKGLIATEGFVSLPLWSCEGAALALRSHFFEFLDEAGNARLAHELKSGSEYSVVLTTSGGLKRYCLHDRVRVTGFENECPLLKFIGRSNNVSDHFGEKVSEQQVDAALTGMPARFLLVACEGTAYTMFVESSLSNSELEDWGAKLESVLCENVHYRYCRELGQLKPVRVIRVFGHGRNLYLAACHLRGQRLGDIKPALLQRTGGWTQVFGCRSSAEMGE